ncbi:MAG TPA: hypothetical protein EYG75_06955 [Campylobacterales bacterium]|nr:hypothetical protein [Campylobacterales bacterium]
MIKNIVLFMLMFSLCLFAESSKNISATYKITFGIAGQVGTVQTTIRSKDGRYKIEAKGATEGIVKALGGERVDIQKSVGLTINDNLLPPE